jgi:hypothetical protein
MFVHLRGLLIQTRSLEDALRKIHYDLPFLKSFLLTHC